MSSDHSPIILTLSETILKKQPSPTLVNMNTDWENFKLDLESVIDLKVPLKNPQQLDEDVQKLVTNIQQCAWKNTPITTFTHRDKYYPLEIINLIAKKRKQRQIWHMTRAPQDKTKLNKLTKKIKRTIVKFDEQNMDNQLGKLTNDRTTDYSLWKMVKNIDKPIIASAPLKEENGGWAINNDQKAVRFSQHLEQIFQPNQNTRDTPLVNEPADSDTEIKLVTPNEVQKEIKQLKRKKSPGFDLITGDILHNLPRKAIVKLTTLINATFRLQHVPDMWKVAEIIMIPKPGKPLNETSSYRPISLLPIISKLFEKLLLKRLKPIIQKCNLIPDYQFGFRERHSTIDQVHRITNVIEKALEEKKVCSTVFLDVAQAFDKVWHEGLMCKLSNMLPLKFAELLKSYLTQRMFRVRQEDAYSPLRPIKAGVPQGSVLGPILYLLYTCDIPELEQNTIATFADDTAIMATGTTHKEAVQKVQTAVNAIHDWTCKWKIKLNESKSIHVDFTNKNTIYHPVFINNTVIPYANTAKYLGMTLDAKLRWRAHVKKKRTELELRYRSMNWLLGKYSKLSIHNKLLLYKQVLTPIWTYGIQLWGCAKNNNIEIIQRFQNKVLRDLVNAPWFIRNEDLHRDLKVDLVTNVIKKFAEAHQRRLHHHVNVEAIQLLDTTGLVRRLKRKKPFELI